MATLADQFLDDSSSDSAVQDTPHHPPATGPPSDTIHHFLTPPSPHLSTTASSLNSLVARLSSTAPADHPSLLRQCVRSVADARQAASAAHVRVRELYSARFPELASLMPSAPDFAAVARRLGNDITARDDSLAAVVGAAGLIAVQVAASNSSGRRLDGPEMTSLDHLLAEAHGVEAAERALLDYIEERATKLAPNVVRVVGGKVAAQLLGEAGGLDLLAAMPSCNVRGLGRVRGALLGGSSAKRGRHDGLVHTCPRVLALPEKLRTKGGDYVANKVVLAARVDYARERRDGSMGGELGKEIDGRFQNWQEAAPARTAKPLPIPGDFKKKHRAGKRARKQKELYGMTEMRKQANRVNFNQPEAQYGNDMESSGLGVLGGVASGEGRGSGRLKVGAKKSNSLSLAAKRKLAKAERKGGLSAVAASGLTTTVEGIELGTMTPAPGGIGLGRLHDSDGTKSVYFAPTTGFASLPSGKMSSK